MECPNHKSGNYNWIPPEQDSFFHFFTVHKTRPAASNDSVFFLSISTVHTLPGKQYHITFV